MYYMDYLYEHLDLLMYLRYHPRWYKILYYQPDYFKYFVREAKENLGIRTIDKLDKFKSQVQLFSNLASMFPKTS